MPFPAWLLRSKVAPTRQRVDLLERPLLTARLHRALDAMLSVIHAPAGYGKSTLLASWRQQLLAEGHTVCWLSLGRQENDPIQLLTYVAFALSAGGVRFDVSSGELSEREFLSVIIHAAAEHDRRIVLVLDDFENLEAPAVDGVVQPLIGHAPANLHIAIATRDASRLRIANLEARGQAVSFGVAQLRFTAAELDAFLSDALGAARLRQLYAMTEGWPVAVQMIRSAVRNAEDADRILRDLTGDAGQMAAYLSEEVLGRLEPGLQEFLMDIALVDRIDCALANHLRECDDGHARFAQARALDALVLPLDSMESTYRLHPLFREHLYERLQATRRDRGRALHLRAAQWFSERGDLVEAVRHCVHAGAESHAGDIVHGAGGVMLWFREGLARLRAIMALLSETTVLADWRLALIRCLLFVKDGEVHRARLLYDAITARCDVRSDDLGTPVAGSSVHEFAVMAIVISLYEGNPISQAHCRELEARIDALEEGEHAVRGHLLTFLCISYLQRGEFRDARRAGERAIPAFMAFGSLYGTAYIYFGSSGNRVGKS
jgi:LuxR family maltose regulon positive regulatory protein